MPLLEYRCHDCEKKAELLVLAGDANTAPVCPSCGSPNMTRLLSTFAAHAGHGGTGTGDADTMCGGGPCAMPGICGPSACGYDEN
jgi:putative FmdB family regulatory protein